MRYYKNKYKFSKISKISFYILCGTIFLLTDLLAQNDVNTENMETYFLEAFHSFMDTRPSIDHDYPCIQFTFANGIQQASVGNKFIAFGINTGKHRIVQIVSGMIELHNFSPKQPMPWELWRGNLGLGLAYSYDYKYLDNRITFWLETGYYHQSDHPTNLRRYASSFLDYENPTDILYSFDYANISAYEYIPTKIGAVFNLNELLDIDVSIGTKFFTPSINPGDRRNLENSWMLETSMEKTLSTNFSVYAGIYIEQIKHNFDFKTNHFIEPENKTKLNYFRAVFGLKIRNKNNNSIIPHIIWDKSNGRGLDFPKQYNYIGFGLKLLI